MADNASDSARVQGNPINEWVRKYNRGEGFEPRLDGRIERLGPLPGVLNRWFISEDNRSGALRIPG
jgi:hypothetical protein